MNHKDLANETIDVERARRIGDGVRRVFDAIAAAEDRAGRAAGSVRLLAATKTRDVGEIMAAIDAGVRLIGENRPQEITAKAEGLARQLALRPGCDVELHLIGQLQSNKINKVLPYAGVIESVDGMELARKIASRAAARGTDVGVLLEVNESGEESKSGCDPDEAVDLAHQIAGLEGLRLRGLMTIGAHVDDEATIRRGFAHLRGVRDVLLASGDERLADAHELSMGMTGDMALAIEEGSTIVRVGTAIFGPRAFV